MTQDKSHLLISSLYLKSVYENKSMHIVTKQIDYIANWHIATGYDAKGRHLSGSGHTASEAIQDALNEYIKYAHKLN